MAEEAGLQQRRQTREEQEGGEDDDDERRPFNMKPRILTDIARETLNSKKATALGKAMVTAYVTDAVWTPTRAKEAGYNIEGGCDLCGDPCDDIFHRLCLCRHPEVAQSRKEHMDKMTIPIPTRQAIENDSEQANFWCKGRARHPVDQWPRPTTKMGCIATYKGEPTALEDMGARLGGDF